MIANNRLLLIERIRQVLRQHINTIQNTKSNCPNCLATCFLNVENSNFNRPEKSEKEANKIRGEEDNKK